MFAACFAGVFLGFPTSCRCHFAQSTGSVEFEACQVSLKLYFVPTHGLKSAPFLWSEGLFGTGLGAKHLTAPPPSKGAHLKRQPKGNHFLFSGGGGGGGIFCDVPI